MDVRVVLFLFVLSTGWCCNARVVTTNLFPIQNGIASGSSETIHPTRNQNKNVFFGMLQINHQQQEREVEAVKEFDRNKQLCTLCEEFTTLAFGYLAKNKTQTEIISILHKTCSKLPNLEQQCIILVDYYAPPLFLEVSTVQPEELCRTIDLCEQIVSISQHLSKNSCEFCHHVVTEALRKLKDPDTQLDIVELLLKACDAVEGYVKKCKRLVLEYAPLILTDAEKFLESHDICTMMHACSSATTTTEQVSSYQTSLHSAS